MNAIADRPLVAARRARALATPASQRHASPRIEAQKPAPIELVRTRSSAVVHPWHGLEPGSPELMRGTAPLAPGVDPLVSAFIEIPRGSRAKMELDAATGLVVLDRILPGGVVYPSMYGEVPQTICGARTMAVCERAVAALALPGGEIPLIKNGDGDPLDIMVLADDDGPGAPTQAGFALKNSVRIIGVLWMVDDGEADPKIVGVMKKDPTFGEVTDVAQVPERVKDLVAFLESYKQSKPAAGGAMAMRAAALAPDEAPAKPKVVVGGVSGPALAVELLRASVADYDSDVRPGLRAAP